MQATKDLLPGRSDAVVTGAWPGLQAALCGAAPSAASAARVLIARADRRSDVDLISGGKHGPRQIVIARVDRVTGFTAAARRASESRGSARPADAARRRDRFARSIRIAGRSSKA
jgi:hypothetical protein